MKCRKCGKDNDDFGVRVFITDNGPICSRCQKKRLDKIIKKYIRRKKMSEKKCLKRNV